MLFKLLDPKNEAAFKKIFGTKKNKDILIHFLNDIIVFKGREPIKKVTFLKSKMEPEIEAKKSSVVDVLCEDEKGSQYIVELQIANEKGFEKKAHYYASKAYVSQMDNGNEIIFLAITSYVVFPNKENYKSDHVILEEESHQNNLKNFSFTFLELPKFNGNIDELSTTVDKWAYFFKHAEKTSEDDFEKLFGNNDTLKKAYKELNRINWTPSEIYAYEEAEEQLRYYNACRECKFDEGVEQGVAEGRDEVRADIIKKMISNGFEVDEIYSMTGLKDLTSLDDPKLNEEIDEETSKDDLEKLVGKDDIIEKAFSALNPLNWAPEWLYAYELSEEYRKDFFVSLQEKFDEGLEKGRGEGVVEGRAEIIKKMKKSGLRIEEIHSITGLSELEINSALTIQISCRCQD